MGALIAQLIVALGPAALQLIPTLINIWNKQSLTDEEVRNLTAVSKTTYDAYVANARAANPNS